MPWRTGTAARPLLPETEARAVADGLAAGALAGALSGIPSTGWTLVRGGNPLGAVRAAGTLVLRSCAGPVSLLVAGAGTHTVISFGWAMLLAVVLPEHRTRTAGAAAGLAIAALDLGAVGRRYPAIRALPTLPQIADHVAFGFLVGAVVQARRRRRP